MNYIPVNNKDKQEMLNIIGVNDADSLISAQIPDILRAKKLDISSSPLTEQQLLNKFKQLSKSNKSDLICFRGAGIYDHFIPSLIDEITGRSEFLTAYTPYQAEASQGTLQAIFEYQSMICSVTGMDTSNASLYDGATAVAEAVLLAIRTSRKNKVILSSAIHPEYIATVKTYIKNLNIDLIMIDIDKTGCTPQHILAGKLTEDIAAVVIQSPNFYGTVEDMETLSSVSKAKSALFIAAVNPLSLGFFKSPGEYNADIAVGEGQVFGNHMYAGGSTFGFMAVKKALEWKMPGRIVGQTTDTNGKRGFVLTLQSREQHIRREKATSNICTNSALNAFAGCVYMAYLGSAGIKEISEQNLIKSKYAFDAISKIEGFEPLFKDSVFFNEFVFKTTKNINKINKLLLKNNILGPVDLSNINKKYKGCIMFSVTEKRTKAEIDNMVKILSEADKK